MVLCGRLLRGGDCTAEVHALAQHELDAAAAATSQALDDSQARVGRYFHRREMRQRVRRYLVDVIGHVERCRERRR